MKARHLFERIGQRDIDAARLRQQLKNIARTLGNTQLQAPN